MTDKELIKDAVREVMLEFLFNQPLTISKAAELLGVSRPHVYKLIERGTIHKSPDNKTIPITELSKVTKSKNNK